MVLIDDNRVPLVNLPSRLATNPYPLLFSDYANVCLLVAYLL